MRSTACPLYGESKQEIITLDQESVRNSVIARFRNSGGPGGGGGDSAYERGGDACRFAYSVNFGL